jgi:hypothetical protein
MEATLLLLLLLGVIVVVPVLPVPVLPQVATVSFGVNVRQAGAVGDNSSSDSSAFETALTSSTAGHGRLVLVPAGLYRLTRTLQLDRTPGGTGVALTGEGIGASKLLWGGNDSAVIEASAAGTGHVTIRDISLHPLDLTVARLVGARPGQHGIVLGPVQNPLVLERVEIFSMGGDGLHHRGNSALVTLHASDIHSNFGWGVRATAESGGPAENLVITANSIYANLQGGVAIESSYGCSVRDNDIEGGNSPRKPLLFLSANSVYVSGNTLGLASGDGSAVAAIFEGSNIVSVGGSYTINGPNQTAVRIACREQSADRAAVCPVGVTVQGAVFAAGASGGGTGLEIGPGVGTAPGGLIGGGVVIIAPLFANGFTKCVSDLGHGTVFIPPLAACGEVEVGQPPSKIGDANQSMTAAATTSTTARAPLGADAS